jgi:hypothetical protein
VPDFSIFSAFFDSLSDDESYYKFNQEMNTKMIGEQLNNQFKDKSNFLGELLLPCQECTGLTDLSDGTDVKTYVTKIRLDDIDTNMYSHPSDIPDSKRRQSVIDQHQTAYITVDPSTTSLPKPGDKVDCYYHEAGPNEQGKQRGLRFKPEIVSASKSTIGSFGSGSNSAESAFNSKSQPTPIAELASESAPDYIPDNFEIPDESFLQRAYESFGETYTKPIVGDLRLISIRFPQKQSNLNSYSDSLIAFYSTANGIEAKSYQMTTLPGQHIFGEDTYTAIGTGLVSSGFTKNMWQLGTHTGYTAGSQSRGGSPTYFIRDNNRNGQPDVNSDGTSLLQQKFGSKGFNLHRSSASKKSKNISGKSSPQPGRESWAIINGTVQKRNVGIWTYSAGCQVFADPGNFSELMSVWTKNNELNKITKYDYIMLSYQEYLTLKSGQLFDGINKMKRLESDKLASDQNS